MMAIDLPMLGTTLSGQFETCGWAHDHSVISEVQVTVDGIAGGTADYGQLRADVAYPAIALRGIAPGQFARSEDSGNSLVGHATCIFKARLTPPFKGAKIAHLNLGGRGGACARSNSRSRARSEAREAAARPKI